MDSIFELWAALTALVSSSEFLDWFQAIGGVVLAAKAVTVLTPTRHDDAAVAAVLKVLNWLALNVLRDRNADDAAPAADGS